MTEPYGIIYKATNIVNGKIYIGQTTKTLKQRMEKHLYDAKIKRHVNCAFHNAINKYGKENFVWEQIDVAYNKEELNEKEEMYIKENNSCVFFDDNNGYNVQLGGNQHNAGIKLTDEHKQKIAEATKKHWETFDENALREKGVKAMQTRIKNGSKPLKEATPLYAYAIDSDEVIYAETIHQMAKFVNGTPQHICDALKGRINNAYGYEYEYAKVNQKAIEYLLVEAGY